MPIIFVLLLSVAALPSAQAVNSRVVIDTDTGALALSALIASEVPAAKVQGEATYSYLFWDLYRARLYSPDGKWHSSKPFALSLTYLTALSGKDIAEHSAIQMKRQGSAETTVIDLWQTRLTRLFPDVRKQDRLTGIATTEGRTQFFLNSEFLGEISDPLFTRAFFNIWLGADTAAPQLRAQLLQLEVHK